MKNVIKNMFLCFTIIFSIIIICYTIYNYNITRDITNNIVNKSNSIQINEEIISLQENISLLDFLKLNYYNGKVGIFYEIFNIVIISSIISVLLGTIISIKEYPKTRYFLYFILGNIIYNTIFSIIIHGIYLKNNIQLTFFECFYESIKNTLLNYIIFFIIINGVIVLIKKVRIKKLNNELNKKNNK